VINISLFLKKTQIEASFLLHKLMFQRLRHQQRLILSSNGNMRGLSRPVLPLVYNSSSRSLNCFSSTVSGTSTHSKFSSFFLPSSMSASYSSSTTAPTASRMSPMRMRSLFAHVVDKTHGEVDMIS